MRFLSETLQDTYRRVRADFLSQGVRDKGFVHLMTFVISGASYLMHQHLKYLHRNSLPDKCDGPTLLRWASIWGMTLKRPAKAAAKVIFRGEESAVIPDGVELISGNGRRYRVGIGDDVVRVSDNKLIPIEALDFGPEFNNETIESLTIAETVAGLEKSVSVEGGKILGGSDLEKIESLRERLLRRIRKEPRGGTVWDYIRWLTEVEGVKEIFVLPRYDNIGREEESEAGRTGVVGISVIVDKQSVAFREDDLKIIEDSEIPRELRQRIFDVLEEKAPITAKYFVFLPRKKENFRIEITNLNTASSTVHGNIRREIEAFFDREIKPGRAYGSSGLTDGTLYKSQLSRVINRVPGVEYFDLRIFESEQNGEREVENVTVIVNEMLVIEDERVVIQ